MTTSQSPLGQLRAQADKIAGLLKAAERGEPVGVAFAARIAEARERPGIKIAIVMDDKTLTPEIPWATIRGLSEPDLARWIVTQMRGEPANG